MTDGRAFARLFDHSIVRPDATLTDVALAAETAARLGTATLTVQAHYVRTAARELRGTGVLVGTVVGFPHGNETPSMKAAQAAEVLDHGADEIDMVICLPALKNGEQGHVVADVAGVVHAAQGRTVKVITENGLLTEVEKRLACEWVAQAGAHFVKTSTAYGPGGATLADVRLMHQAVAGRCRVKAAGGIRTVDEVLAFLQAGASRFGSTRTGELVAAFEALGPAAGARFAEHLTG